MAIWLFCYRLIVRFETTDALSVRVMPHAIRMERAILTGAKAYFLHLTAHTINALGSDRFER